MKNVVKYLFSFLGLFVIGTVGVNALEIDKDDIKNSTYVIGTHMFTRDSNSDYNGQLTTKHIMLAAKTIVGNDLDDMIIYYKNARGNWVDAMKGTTVTMSETIEVEHTNARIQLDTPVLATTVGAFATDGHGSFSYLYDVTHIDNATGVEVYSKTGEDGEYSLLSTTLVSDLKNINDTEHGVIVTNGIELLYETGYNSYYKIRTYKVYGEEKVYSNFSNELNIHKTIETPTITFDGKGGNSATGETGRTIKVDKIAEDINVYYSTSEDGEYSLLQTVSYEDYDDEVGISISVPQGKHYYYKVRLSYTYDDETLYGEYSNVLDHDNPIETPVLSFAPIGAAGGIPEENVAPLQVNSMEGVTGVEVYRLTDESEEYSLLKTVTKTEYETLQFGISDYVPYGSSYNYKVRTYVTYGEGKVYSEYSNVLTRSHLIGQPELGASTSMTGEQYISYSDGKYLYDLGIDSDNYKALSPIEVISYAITGWELYEKDSHGDYNLISNVRAGTLYSLEINEGETKTFVARAYKTIEEKTKYSEYSEEFVIDTSKIVRLSSNGKLNGDSYDLTLSTESFMEATGMEVYRSTAFDGNYILLETVDTTTYETSIPTGKSYYYKVRLYTMNGEEKVYSDYSSISGYDNNEVAPILSQSEATGQDSGYGILLSVASLGDATGMEVYYSTSENGEYISIGISSNETPATYLDIIEAGLKKYYKVRLYTMNGEVKEYGKFSNVVSYDNPLVLTGSNEGLGVTMDEAVGYVLSVDSIGYYSSLDVYRSTSESGEYEFIGQTHDNEDPTKYTTTIPLGKHYYYKVKLSTDTESFSNIVDYNNVAE